MFVDLYQELQKSRKGNGDGRCADGGVRVKEQGVEMGKKAGMEGFCRGGGGVCNMFGPL